MAAPCGHCKSTETQAVASTIYCLACGNHTDLQGRPVEWVRLGERHRLYADSRFFQIVDPKVVADGGEFVPETELQAESQPDTEAVDGQ